MSATRAESVAQPPGEHSRVRALVEVVAIVAAAMAVLWLASRLPAWIRWENATFGGVWLVQILAFMVVPLILARALGHRPGRLGVTVGSAGRPLEVGLTALAVVGPVTGMVFPLLGALGWTPYDWRGGAVLAAAYGACFPLVGLVVRKVRPSTAEVTTAKQLAGATGALVVGAVVAALCSESVPIVSRILLALAVVGPGEETLFRGVVQTRLDLAFGRPWRLFGADLGWGWILASLLFGLAHLTSPSMPWQGGWALWTVFAGLLFGYLRAKGGSVLASALVHGVLLAVAAIFVP